MSTEACSVYSLAALIELVIAQPDASYEELGAHFGKTASWFIRVLASDAFQLALDPRRAEVNNPLVTATLEERFRGLALHSLDVLHTKLDNPEVADMVVLKATEIGVKALGLGALQPVVVQATVTGDVDVLAERLTAALERQRRNVRQVAVQAATTIVVVAVKDEGEDEEAPLTGVCETILELEI